MCVMSWMATFSGSLSHSVLYPENDVSDRPANTRPGNIPAEMQSLATVVDRQG